jgi:DNA-binding FadR family transcriptional regulator
VERVHVPKTAEVVARTLRSQIVRGEIPEGAALPSESELMNRFGISRPSLREAFRILESEQLITVRRGARGGARVTHPDLTVAARYLSLLMHVDAVLLSDVFHARALIEPIAFRLLAARDDRDTATEQLLEIFERLSPDMSAVERADVWTEFFLTLFHRAGNRTLHLLYGTLTEVLRQELVEWSAPDSPQAELATSKAVHKVMRLVAKGDGDAAARFWRSQMLALKERADRVHGDRTVAGDT